MGAKGQIQPTKPLSDKEFGMVIAMIRIQCTRDEVASVLGMSEDTLNRRIAERGEGSFASLFKKYAAEGATSLRRAQWQAAVEKKNPTMLIWLGKQYLGQSDKMELGGRDGGPIPLSHTIDATALSDSALEELMAARLKPARDEDEDDEGDGAPAE